MSDAKSPAPPAATPASDAFNPGGPIAAATTDPSANAMIGAVPDGVDLGRRLDALSLPQKAAAARQAEILNVVGRGLAAHPYVQRRSILDHLAPALAARGVAPEILRAFDPTDANLIEALGSVTAIGRRLQGG
jgi:hypothetical protein